MTCRGCEYAGFCLQCVHVDAEHLPAGFRLRAKSAAAPDGAPAEPTSAAADVAATA